MTSLTRVLQAGDGSPTGLAAIVAALSARYDVVTGPSRPVRRARLDTFDRRLRSAGLTLEHQIVDSDERLVLGRENGSTVAMTVTGLRFPALACLLPAGPVRDVVAPLAGVRALLAISDERRLVRQLELRNADGKIVARVDIDEPASRAGSAAEVAVHALRGYDEQARRVTRLLTGLGLREVGPDARRAVPPAGVDRAAPATVLLTGVLSRFSTTMRENLPGVLDDVDTEFLHDFRVAVRRTRSTLKLGRPALPAMLRTRWEPAFKRVGDLTTPVRDLDVYELRLPAMAGWLMATDVADLGAFASHLRRQRTAELGAMVRALRSTGFGRLATQWKQALALLADTPDARPDAVAAGQLAASSISQATRRVLRGGAAISPGSPAQDLHRLRGRCKELRYALEVFAPVIDTGARRRAVADLTGLQDVLGRFQDSEVQHQAMRGFAREMMADGVPAAALLAMGELIGHLDTDQRRARGDFDSAFARFARPSSHRQLLGSGR